MSKKVKVRVPATITDIGPGFNSLSLAVGLYNYITIEETAKPGFYVTNLNEAVKLPSDENNAIVSVVKDFLIGKLNYKLKQGGIHITNDFRVPLNRGLNSLAVAVVGALIASSVFADVEIYSEELLSLMRCYQSTPQNFAATVIGGFVITSPVDETFVAHRIEFPEHLKMTLIIPEYDISVGDPGRLMSHKISMKDAVFNISRASLLISALCQKNFKLLNLAMEDKIHQPFLRRKIPGAEEISIIAKTCDNLGITMCGNGATILIFHTQSCDTVIKRIERAYMSHKIKSRAVTVELDDRGGGLFDE
jgi:homoserine kinase